MESFEKLKIALDKAGVMDSHRTLVRGEYLKKPHTRDTNIYFVLEGSLRVFFLEDEEEHIMYFGHKNSLITDIDSFFSGNSSELAIQAIKAAKVQFTTKEVFMDFIQSNTENMKLWQRVMGDLVQFQTEREKDLFTSSPLKRYQRTIRRRPDLFQEIPHKYIASYLRMTPETLSRIQKP